MERLSASGGNLPLAFQVREHLEGTADPFVAHSSNYWVNELATQDRFAGEQQPDEGQPLYGSALNASLAAEGYGAHETLVAGLFAMPGHGGAELFPWTKSIPLLGALDIHTLARAIYGLARDFIKGYAPGDTPPEIYVTDIQVGEISEPEQGDLFATKPAPSKPQPPPPPKRIRKGQKQYVGYVDSKTGEYISHDKYIRSRRALRANARRKGLARPKRGRYRKSLIDLPNDHETTDED